MRDEECVQFLQWVLPQLHMHWPGFRKVRGQVCKRIARRFTQLGINSILDYRNYLENNMDEWSVLDKLCRVTISRFYRDKLMYAFLAQQVLPALAEQAIARNADCLNVWSVGCGSGEEPYTIALVWQWQLQQLFPQLPLNIMATDTNPTLCQRAEQACYEYGSIKNLPAIWREQAFIRRGDNYCLKPEYHKNIHIRIQDVREAVPADVFDLIFCRNLVFTYFEEELQCAILKRMQEVLKPGGALVIGIHENLPERASGFQVWSDKYRIYRKIV